MFIAGLSGSVFASFGIIGGFESSSINWLLFGIHGAWIAIAVIATLYVRSSVVTVRIDADAISYVRGAASRNGSRPAGRT